MLYYWKTNNVSIIHDTLHATIHLEAIVLQFPNKI